MSPCSLALALAAVANPDVAGSTPAFAALQQSRGFGNDFKFPEGGVGGGLPPAAGGTAPAGGFAPAAPGATADDDDDLYN